MAFPVIRASLQEAAAFTTTQGKSLGFLNYMSEIKTAVERVAPRYFKVDGSEERPTTSTFKLEIELEGSGGQPSNHLAKVASMSDAKHGDPEIQSSDFLQLDDACKQRRLEEEPEAFYDAVIRPYPIKDFRHMSSIGLQLRLGKEFVSDTADGRVYNLRLAAPMNKTAQFIPDRNTHQAEPSMVMGAALGKNDLHDLRFMQIGSQSCQYRVFTQSATNGLQKKRVIAEVPGCNDLDGICKFDDGKSGNKSKDVKFSHKGGGKIEIKSSSLTTHEFIAASNSWTDVTHWETEEPVKTESGNQFNIGFGIDKSKTRISQDRGVLIVDVFSMCDDVDSD